MPKEGERADPEIPRTGQVSLHPSVLKLGRVGPETHLVSTTESFPVGTGVSQSQNCEHGRTVPTSYLSGVRGWVKDTTLTACDREQADPPYQLQHSEVGPASPRQHWCRRVFYLCVAFIG